MQSDIISKFPGAAGGAFATTPRTAQGVAPNMSPIVRTLDATLNATSKVTGDAVRALGGMTALSRIPHAAMPPMDAAFRVIRDARLDAVARVAGGALTTTSRIAQGVALNTSPIVRTLDATLNATSKVTGDAVRALGGMTALSRISHAAMPPMDAAFRVIRDARLGAVARVAGGALTTTSRIVQGVALDTNPIVRTLDATFNATAKIMGNAVRVLGDMFNAPELREVFRYYAFTSSVQSAGWLPYYTITPDDVEDCGADTELVDARIESFYKTHWDIIRKDIESRMDQYQISDETKATFREAIEAHDSGLYRCVIAVLFPKIEEEFEARVPKNRDSQSQRARKVLQRAGACRMRVPQKAYGWALYGPVENHIYSRVDASNIEEFERDDIPNRHAALHGLVRYWTHKHSMNMIVLTDYIFQVLSTMAE